MLLQIIESQDTAAIALVTSTQDSDIIEIVDTTGSESSPSDSDNKTINKIRKPPTSMLFSARVCNIGPFFKNNHEVL